MTETTINLNPESEQEFRYVLVGNIIDKYFFGENREIRSGTKHFRPGAKVYLLPEYGGMGHENMPVYGLPRKSRKLITITIRTILIKNVRIKREFSPTIIEKIKKNHFYKFLEKDTITLQKFADYWNGNHIEIT